MLNAVEVDVLGARTKAVLEGAGESVGVKVLDGKIEMLKEPDEGGGGGSGALLELALFRGSVKAARTGKRTTHIAEELNVSDVTKLATSEVLRQA